MIVKEGFQAHPSLIDLFKKSDPERGEQLLHFLNLLIKQRRTSRKLVITADDVLNLFERGDESIGRFMEISFSILFDASRHLNPVGNYHQLFQDRYDKFLNLWLSRPGSRRLDDVSFVVRSKSSRIRRVGGLIVNKSVSDMGMKITLEDPTGQIDVDIPKEILYKVSNVPLDSFLVVEVERMETGFIGRDVWWLDIPDKEMKKLESDVFVVITSDLHIGNPDFDEERFEVFLDWLVGINNELISKRVCCLFIIGDIVDAYRLDRKESVYKLYQKFLSYLKRLPDRIIKVIIPGDSDATRRALPQPSIPTSYMKEITSIRNLYSLGNPSLVSINGIKFLLFHGQSLDDVLLQSFDTTSKMPASLGKILLRARHLAPTYGRGTPIAPEGEDLLVIKDVPDVLLLGHVHKASEDFYKNSIIISTSSWIKKGLRGPGRVALLNLKDMMVRWYF
jgi:DNA polymerase II small subunit